MTFLLPLLGWGQPIAKWFGEIKWYYITIAALCAVCVILWTGWGKSADGLKAERAKTVILRQSVAELMLAVKNQNDAIEALATEGKKRSQAGKDALQARQPARVASQARIDRLAHPDALTGRCVTSVDVLESGL